MDSSTYVSKEPCPSCGSRDNLARYDDGHGYCFGCGYYDHPSGTSAPVISKADPELIQQLTYTGLKSRALTEASCRLWGYSTSTMSGKPVQVATYYNEARTPVAQKVRFKDKSFTWKGSPKSAGLYGQWLWPSGGKRLIITEGEIDAISVSQAMGHKWPVVSIPNGAQGAAREIKKNLEWISKFEKVVLCFDNDDPGKAAVEACVPLLPLGRAYVASLPLKDASDMLQAGRTSELVSALWGAREYRPDGIVAASDLFNVFISEEDNSSVSYPWAGLQAMTDGLRKREIVTLCAGSGIGKSSVCRELAHWLLKNGHKVGYIGLEENVKTTLRALVGIEINKPLRRDITVATQEELEAGFAAVAGSGNLYLYDHFGSLDSDHLLDRVRYMVVSLGVSFVVLDHISIVVSGNEEITDERRAIDVTMTKLRSLVEETGVGLILVSHLKRPEGKGHEEGARVSLAQLRGSAGIAQLSDRVIGLERNQQAPERKDLTTIRVLKDRFTGDTGEACVLRYNRDTGRLMEATDDDGGDDFGFTTDADGSTQHDF